MFRIVCVLLLILSSTFLWGQDRFDSGELQGFTKSRTEGIINRLDEPIVVRHFEGVVVRSVGDESPLHNALIELRGPGDSMNVRAIKTDRKGRFHLDRVPAGKYVFKVTFLGFQSILGTVTISPTATDKTNALLLRMVPGV